MDTHRIDWTQPVEAVHVDGRVVAVSLDPEYPAPDNSGNYTLIDEPAGDSWYVWTSEGKSWIQEDHEWTIRNVAPKEVEWGPEIKVEGKRPEWLGDYEGKLWWFNQDQRNGIQMDNCANLNWGPYLGHDFGEVKSIRLPANHPHYTPPTRTAFEQRISPKLLDRMVIYLLECAAVHGIRPKDPESQRRYDEMKAIAAELSEPAHRDRHEVKRLVEIWGVAEDAAYEILSRGRALERGE